MPRRRARRRDESGFTLVDVVASFVILGIVMAPLAMSLVEAMKVIPSSSTRSINATQRDRLQAQLQTDLSEAGQVVLEPSHDVNGNVTPSSATPTVGFQALPAQWVQATTPLFGNVAVCVTTPNAQIPVFETAVWDAATTPPYYAGTLNVESRYWNMAQYVMLFGAARPDGYIQVEVHRLTTTWDRATAAPSYPAADQSNLYLTTYCKSGEAVALVGTVAPSAFKSMDETATVLFLLHDSPSDAATATSASAALRDRCDTYIATPSTTAGLPRGTC